eukprot:TRINITY_DN6109_c0_g2_i1.p1 TRINITY_DN6109_c0_g2~~TRINITY_DN6109_c0_g2_i1.p1  ORF type:complete len:1935 (-),score=346.71 TRINITY_DN6109_c0_g2_i1:397-6201(-)
MDHAKRRKVDTGAVGGSASKPDRSVEETYQKKTQLEHILLRPDSYVGSTERQQVDHWIYERNEGRMVQKKLDYVPALYKIFDEILVNAADNLVRCPAQDEIRVDINTGKGCITVWNNGSGLPVQLHREHKCYVAELVFGQLLTSDNYDDSEKKVTGGRNGYGAKLTNIFSTQFILETQDSVAGKRYKQVWEKNMSVCKKPELRPSSGTDFTQVTFFPDFPRFGMTSLEADIASLMRRRAFDVAAATHGRCKVILDGEELPCKSFDDYVGLHLGPDVFRICENINERWEVAVGLTDGSGFQQVSFVNSINTSRGGTHVNYLADQVVNAVLDSVSKQKPNGTLAVKGAHVRGHILLFVNCLIENPAFDSQTKETLTSKRERFGSTCSLPDTFLQSVVESGIVDTLLEWCKAMGKSELAQYLNRSDFAMQKRIHGVPKLEDANKAGTKESSDCTLILTEGDSAKALAVAGLSIVGRDHYGVFPLRGKLRNVRELTVKQMMENRELEQVLKILALDASKEYVDTKSLRYGSIMIMTDQDFDGSHIKGLIINFVERWFPSLLKLPGFLKEFVTPIVKATRGDVTQTFFTIREYEEWKDKNDDGRGWKCKYYKGLGTSTSSEAKDYFADLQKHEITFSHTGDEDNELIDMAFNPKRADDRKQWILACEDDTYVDHSQSELSYSDFVTRELVLFAKYDVARMIPSMVDGLKVGQRKVLFGSLKKKIHSDIKVAQLTGFVAEHSAYHHGESSLQGTIIGLAQTFVGSNNINLLHPSGQFGTRLQGGKDHAAARYIFTRLTRMTRCIFPEQDDSVLDTLQEEGMPIEPKWYCPVIPMALVNGAEGIGTGWSTSVPNYNPRDIIANLRRAFKNDQLEPMTPWYRGFTGKIVPVNGAIGKYEVWGVATKRGRTRLEITELPVRRWTQDYKEWLLEQLPHSGDEKRALITEVREHHSENSVHFVVSITPDKLAESERRGLERVFHLRGHISTSNMHLFDAEGHLQKYTTPEEIILAFIPVRLGIYAKRKEHLIQKMLRDLAVISNKLRFVKLVVSEELLVEDRKTSELCLQMRKLGLQTMREIESGNSGCAVQQSTSAAEQAAVDQAGPMGYKYLVSMKMWSLTEEKVLDLTRQHDQRSREIEELRGTSLETLWDRDLVKLEEALDVCDREDRKEAEASAKMAAKVMGDTALVNKQCVIVLSRNYTIKRVRTSEWKARRRVNLSATRGGALDRKGTKKIGAEGEADDDEDDADALAGVFVCYDFDALLVFSEHGMCYMIQALDVPLAKKVSAAGTQLSEFLPELGGSHKITALITVPQGNLKDQSDEFVVLVTAMGMAKKVALDKFRALRPGRGIVAMTLRPRDTLNWAHRASATSALVLVTQHGYSLRTSLGPDFRPSTTKGAGITGIKMREGAAGDRIAAIAVHELSLQELKTIQDNILRKKGLDAAKQSDDGAGVAVGNVKERGLSGVAAEVCPEGNNEDGSDGNAEEDDENIPEEDDEAGEDEAGDEQEEEAADETQNPETLTGQAGEASGDGVKNDDVALQDSRCLLFVTSLGMSLRLPLSCRRVKLLRRGCCGVRVIKLADGVPPDVVVSVHVVSNRDNAGKPDAPRRAFQIWYAEQKVSMEEPNEHEGEAADTLDPAVAEAVPPMNSNDPTNPAVRAFAGVYRMREKFWTLPENEQKVYMDRQERERQRYLAKMAEYVRSQTACEELLLGSQSGNISRTSVGSIPILMRVGRGRTIAKCGKGDRICSVSLLSALETVHDEADDETTATAVPRTTSESTPAAETRRGAASGDVGASADLSSVFVSALAETTGGVFAPMTPPAESQCGIEQKFREPPVGDGFLPPEGDMSQRHLLQRTPSKGERVPPWRRRLSHLPNLPKPPTPRRGKTGVFLNLPRHVRHTMLKVKFQPMGALRRKIVVRGVDIADWARFVEEDRADFEG